MVERKRHLAKAITYRVFGSTATAVIAYIATGHAGIGAAVGVADSLVKIGGYYLHERIWYRIRWGIRQGGSAATSEPVVKATTVIEPPGAAAEASVRPRVRVPTPVAAD